MINTLILLILVIGFKKNWGKGYATEGSKAAHKYGFKQLGYKEVYAMTNVNNLASRRVLKKVGFSFEGLFNYEAVEYSWQKDNEQTTWYKLYLTLGKNVQSQIIWLMADDSYSQYNQLVFQVRHPPTAIRHPMHKLIMCAV